MIQCCGNEGWSFFWRGGLVIMEALWCTWVHTKHHGEYLFVVILATRTRRYLVVSHNLKNFPFQLFRMACLQLLLTSATKALTHVFHEFGRKHTCTSDCRIRAEFVVLQVKLEDIFPDRVRIPREDHALTGL